MNYRISSSRTAWIAILAAFCAASAAVPAMASPSCDSVFPIALLQTTHPGQTVTSLPNRPVGGAMLINCAYRVTGSGSISLKLFDSSLESPYSTTVKQLGMEGYKCLPIDSTLGFPASSCGLAAAAVTINTIVFTTTNGKYAAMLTGAGGSLTPLYAIAKAVNSNVPSR